MLVLPTCVAAFAAGGCSLLAQLASETFSASDGGAPPSDAPATDGEAKTGNDAATGNDAMAAKEGGTPDAPCEFDSKRGWQLDCAFGDGGYYFFDDRSTSAPATVGDVADDVFFVVGGLGRDGGAVYSFSPSGNLDAGLSGSPVLTLSPSEGTPTGLVLGAQGVNLPNIFISSDLGNGIALTGYSLQGKVEFGPLVAVSDGGQLQTVSFADFDEANGALVVANHRVQDLALVPSAILFALDGGVTVSDLPVPDGGPFEQVLGAGLGLGGGFIGVEAPGDLDSSAVVTVDQVGNTFQVRGASLVDILPDGLDSLLNKNGVAVVGRTRDGFGGTIFPAGGAVNEADISSVPFPSIAVSLVVPDPLGLDALALSIDEGGHSLSMIHLIAVAPTNNFVEGYLFDKSFDIDGVAHVALPAHATVAQFGKAAAFQGDVCAVLQVTADDVQRDMMVCLRRGDLVVDAGADASDDAPTELDANGDAADR